MQFPRMQKRVQFELMEPPQEVIYLGDLVHIEESAIYFGSAPDFHEAELLCCQMLPYIAKVCKHEIH